MVWYWAVLLAGSGAAFAWAALAARFLLRLRASWPIEATADPLAVCGPRIDAIVAARNEAQRIAETINCLCKQTYRRLTVTVVDDQSTDGTPDIVQRLIGERGHAFDLRLVRGADRPEGWAGKTWAAHQGVNGSNAEWLLFVDADMQLDERAVATAWRHAERTGADLVSLLPRPRCTTFWQGAAALTIVQLLAHRFPLWRVNDPTKSDAMASGGFILVRRTAYDRAGGHVRLRRAIMDDIELAQRVKSAGGRLAVAPAPTLAHTHMYGSFADIWRGLRKNAYAMMRFRFYKYAIGALLGLSLVWAPLLALALGLASLTTTWGAALCGVGLIGLVSQAAASYPFLRFLRLSPLMLFSSAAGLTLYVAIATSSVWHHLRGRVIWKDRAFEAKLTHTRVPYRVSQPADARSVRADGPEPLAGSHASMPREQTAALDGLATAERL